MWFWDLTTAYLHGLGIWFLVFHGLDYLHRLVFSGSLCLVFTDLPGLLCLGYVFPSPRQSAGSFAFHWSLPLSAAYVLLLIACDWSRDAYGCLSIPLPAAFSTVSLHQDLCNRWLLHVPIPCYFTSHHPCSSLVFTSRVLSQHFDLPSATGLPSRLCICHRFYLCVILHGVYCGLFSAQAEFFCLIHPDWFREFVVTSA